MGDIIHNISRVDQAVCWPDFTAPYSTKPSAELSSCFRHTLSCCSTTSTVDEVQRYARYAIKLVIYALVHVMLSYLLWKLALCMGEGVLRVNSFCSEERVRMAWVQHRRSYLYRSSSASHFVYSRCHSVWH